MVEPTPSEHVIQIQQRAGIRGRVHSSTLRRRAIKVLRQFDLPDSELSLVLTGDEEIRALNASWRGKDAATDVLSFPQEDMPGPPGVRRALGDVVVSIETAERQRARGALPRLRMSGPWSLTDEVTFLMLHGVLHLLGFDHVEDGEAEMMEVTEAAFMYALLNRRR